MKRIDILYDREHYSVGRRDFDELRAEIAEGLAAGVYWLKVNDGEGAPRPAYLLLTPGVPIAIIPIPDEPAQVNGGDPWGGDGHPRRL